MIVAVHGKTKVAKKHRYIPGTIVSNAFFKMSRLVVFMSRVLFVFLLRSLDITPRSGAVSDACWLAERR